MSSYTATGSLSPKMVRRDDERVLVTESNGPLRMAPTTWTAYTDKQKELGLVLVKEGNSDEETLRLRVLDVDGQGVPQRWWKVVAIARAEQMDVVPINWDGEAGKLPAKYTVVDPSQPNRMVYIRLASAGPWACIELEPAPPAESRGKHE